MLKNKPNFYFKVLFCFLLLMSIIIASNVVVASEFPNKPIKIIVPWSPGGSTDVMARRLQPILKSQGVDTVIVNKEGASSVVGNTELTLSAPDGYTVSFASSSLISMIAQGMIEWGTDDFTNIARVSEDFYLLTVRAESKYNTLEEFMDDVKNNPGVITVGASGSGTTSHMDAIVMAEGVESEIRYVPFDGGSKCLASLLGGHIAAQVLKPGETWAQLQSGDIKPLAAFRGERTNLFPDVATFKEKGYNVFLYGEPTQSTFVIAPAGLEKETKEKLGEIFQKAIQSKEFQDYANERGIISEPIIGEELDLFIKNLENTLEVIIEKVL